MKFSETQPDSRKVRFRLPKSPARPGGHATLPWWWALGIRVHSKQSTLVLSGNGWLRLGPAYVVSRAMGYSLVHLGTLCH